MHNFEFLRVSPASLRPWVEEVWYSCGALELPRERVLPSMTTDIVANLGPTMELVEGDGDRDIVGTTVTGLLTAPIVISHPRVHEAVGIRLSVHGLRAVLGVPTAAARDAVIPLREFVAGRLDELAEACHRSEGPRGKLEIAVAWLRRRVAEHAGEIDPVVQWATDEIQRTDGRVSVKELQQRSGYGATRFNQRFVDEVGLTPKKFARVARFHTVLGLLGQTGTLADVAVRCGYTDQAHMNRDFRALARRTPGEVLGSRYASGLTVAEM